MPRLNALVAEDDRHLSQLIRQTLEAAGITVTLAANGQDAVFSADRLPYDVIVLDANMPILDGFEVLELLRADPQYRRTPILMLTALRGEAEVRRAIDLGASAYLAKPFRPNQLIERIQHLLDRRHGPDAIAI